MAPLAPAVAFTALASLGSSASLASAAAHRHAGGAVATVEMHMYKADCGKRHSQTSRYSMRASARARARMPGAGMDPDAITPYEEVLKDGFYEVACVKDSLFTYGDKFHDNKFEYNMGETANVSIVHYDSLVPKEDREPMTHEVCFEFCRTIPDMSFFGLQNGRMCYCAPYYLAMESDSTQCDAVCPGSPTTMCGGKMKSSIFGMHMCANTGEDLAETSGKMNEVSEGLATLEESVSESSAGMQSAADEYQKMFGQAGDPVASDLMQSAKVFAGEMEEAAGKAKKLVEAMGALKADGEGMASDKFETSDAVKKAEATMSDMEETTTESEAATEKLQKLDAAATPEVGDAKDASKLYYPVMYFVDKEVKDKPSTCGGKAAEKPMIGSMDACARACDADLHECVGFSYFPQAGSLKEGDGLCFMFSKLTSATYYTKCSSESPTAAPGRAGQGGSTGGQRRGRFLQKASGASAQGRVEASGVQCVVKFAEFEGTTLKPNPSGKCAGCLKEVTKAERCFV